MSGDLKGHVSRAEMAKIGPRPAHEVAGGPKTPSGENAAEGRGEDFGLACGGYWRRATGAFRSREPIDVRSDKVDPHCAKRQKRAPDSRIDIVHPVLPVEVRGHFLAVLLVTVSYSSIGFRPIGATPATEQTAVARCPKNIQSLNSQQREPCMGYWKSEPAADRVNH